MTTEVTTAPPTPAPEEPGAPPAGNAGPLARALAWALVPTYLIGVAAYLLLDAALHGRGLDPGEGLPLFTGFTVFAAIGALLLARRPRNAVGWVIAAAPIVLVLGAVGDLYAAWVMSTRGRPDTLAVVGGWLQSWYWYVVLGLVFVALPLLFPDGRLPSRRWWPVPALAVVSIGSSCALGMLRETYTGQEVDYRIDNPIGIEGLAGVEELPVFGPLSAMLGVAVLGAVASVAVRFRRSRDAERQQMKWFLFAVSPAVLAPFEGVLPGLGGAVFVWVLIAVPVAVAVAVLRHRLDGIDVVINRTLVYAALTALVIAVYVLVVGYLGAALRREDDLVISLVATGIVAVLFAPARDRLQRAVDRLLYGERAEPYAALARLGERLEATLAPDAVVPAIVSTVREALRLPYAAIVPREGTGAIASGTPTTGTVTLPLLHSGTPVGSLVLGLRPGEESFSAADRRLLGDLARQAGVAVSAARLTADLQRSRERLVATREEERRRLRRDLHDGLGAQLAGLTVQAGVLRTLVRRDPAAAEAMATEFRTELRAAIAEIRRLVHGLRPPALDELGLVGALQRLADTVGADGAGPRITVVAADDLPALPAAVEVAVYRIVQEAVTNVVRHADARTCGVRVDVDPEAVSIEVRDDGRGLPAPGSAGVGLSSMRERAAEMGGECTVSTAPGGGTRVTARLPRSGSG